SPAELKNCPFCGGDASAEPHLQHKPGCYFDVLAQFKAAPIGDLALADEVLAAWNRRAQPAEEVQQDTALLNFIEGNPQLSLRFHKKRWALVGMT
ncbi:Lar family restriction alleviation protein, partial [Acinetobacter baumannii]|nr:Lar family restriction alleviation protein [Acinetobacter baumannii]